MMFLMVVCLSSCRNRPGKKYNSEASGSEQATSAGSDSEISTDQQTAGDSDQTVEDIDGNVYKTVKIGRQTWMAQNLKTTRYNDGTAIPLVTGAAAWSALSAPAYCWYDNDSISFQYSYGALYNGYTVMTHKLCPTNWHVPSDKEWMTLIKHLGGEIEAGYRLRETGTDYWVSPNEGATNEVGFTALPGGLRYQDGSFHDFGFGGYWWTSTESSDTRAMFRYIDYEYSNVFGFNNHKTNGFSVRCLRDY